MTLVLQAVEVRGPGRWRWLLTDEGTGNPLADHEVTLDAAAAEVRAFGDVYGWVRSYAAPDRRTEDEARLVAGLGAWAGTTLLGERIARSGEDMARHGAALLRLGPRAVLVKGGHLESEEAIDLLVTEGDVRRFAAPRLLSKNLHGTGCTLSSAIAANIVLGAPLPEAVAAAKAFVRQAIGHGQNVVLGGAAGPLVQTELRLKL